MLVLGKSFSGHIYDVPLAKASQCGRDYISALMMEHVIHW